MRNFIAIVAGYIATVATYIAITWLWDHTVTRETIKLALVIGAGSTIGMWAVTRYLSKRYPKTR